MFADVMGKPVLPLLYMYIIIYIKGDHMRERATRALTAPGPDRLRRHAPCGKN
jgi:hypothetical protein